jgi:hypothetical protein
MKRFFKITALASIAMLVAASIVEARGGRGGGGGGGGGGRGGRSGRSGRSGGMGGPGGRPTGRQGPQGAGGNTSAEALKEQEERNALIMDRRKRMADQDRVANQEARLAAARAVAAALRSGADVR